MSQTKTPRKAWIDAGLTALAEHGVDAVRVEVLARSLGVTKGGLPGRTEQDDGDYGYFEGRDELLALMLSTWEQTVTDSVVARVEASLNSDPRDQLKRLMTLIGNLDEPAMRIDTEIAIRDWGRRASFVADVVANVDSVRGSYLRNIFAGFCSPDEAEARTVIAMSVRLAGQTMALGTGRYSRDQVRHLIEQRLLA